jgi:ABC-type histidine transport system ATPase subunit
LSLLTIEGLAKRFGAAVALAGIDLSVQPGEFLALLGCSNRAPASRRCCGWWRGSSSRMPGAS